jgi:hypothetical protein
MAVWIENISTNSCFGLHIYLRTNKTLMHNSFVYLTTWGGGKNFRYKKMQYNYSKKMFTRRAKPIQIKSVGTSGVLL